MAADESGYDLSDPKHPTYHDRYSGLWDDRDKTVRTTSDDNKDCDPGDCTDA
jgi:hypothetical protein